MDRVKLSKANEIMAKISEYNELASDLQSVNCISFFIHDRSADRRVAVLWKDGEFVRNTADGRQLLTDANAIELFDIVVGNVREKIEDRRKALEEEFERL